MKYENGKDIFPEALLRQIQKYVSGKTVYIPAREEKQSWGETSGYKRYIYERNCEIKTKFKAGTGIETLAEEYTRCCGPEEGMKYHIPADWFEKHVTKLQDVLMQQEDMPPLIVHYVEGGFELNDGNHRLEAYSRLGIAEYYVIVWITEKEELEDFKEKYSMYL